MARNFAADGDLVSHTGAAATLDATGSVLLWMRPTSTTDRQSWCATNASSYGGDFRADLAGDNFSFYRERATTAVLMEAAAANFAAYANNAWVFFGAVFDTAAAASAQRLFMGSLTLAAAEPSSYATQTAGSGTNTASSSPIVFGNGGVTTREFKGDIAWVGVWNRVLTQNEVRDQQWHPHVTSGCVLFSYYNGFATEPDWSGQASNGSPTGTTVVKNAPIRSHFGMDVSLDLLVAAAPPSGRIWKLAGYGGGLAGPARGLAGESVI